MRAPGTRTRGIWPGSCETDGGTCRGPLLAASTRWLTPRRWRASSPCYQASMLREEERQVVFRAILAEPAFFASEGRPPEGLQRLAFPHSLPFDPRELRRLSVAADPQRTLIGVQQDEEGSLQIWGLINSGTRWLRDVKGGRRAGAPLPEAPVVHVNAPGSIEAYRGHELLGKLQGGRLSGFTFGGKASWAGVDRRMGGLLHRSQECIGVSRGPKDLHVALSNPKTAHPARCLCG